MVIMMSYITYLLDPDPEGKLTIKKTSNKCQLFILFDIIAKQDCIYIYMYTWLFAALFDL